MAPATISDAFRGLYSRVRETLRSLIPFKLRRRLVKSLRRPRPYARLAHGTNSPATEVAWAPAGVYDVILFSIIDWDFRFQRPQHLVSALAQAGHRGFYLRTTFHETGPRALVGQLADRVYDVQLPGPATFDLYQDEFSANLVEAMLAALNGLRQAAGITDAVCLVQLPAWEPVAAAAAELWGWKLVYDCLDEHSGFGTMSSKGLDREAELFRRSDLVVATSQSLYAKAAKLARRSVRIPNAGDFEHFRQAGSGVVLPELQGPVIGYYGAIAEWFDVELVCAAAAARPSWNFVLIGHTTGADIRPLRRFSNVHLVGEQPYNELPAYLHRFDVACIPFRLNRLTAATDPVKFYEYLSAGKPVVAVRLPELERHSGLFYPVTGAVDFVTQLEAALREDSPNRVSERVEFARQNTWRHRAIALDTAVRGLFAKVAVIIVSYQNEKLLRQCLDSVFSKTFHPNFEVIVVDNASAAGVTAYLQELAATEPRLRVILNSTNVGFAAANNQGIRAADPCEYVILLNNDTIVTPDWLSRLVYYLGNPQIGLVGPVSNGVANEAQVDLGLSDMANLDASARAYAQGREGRIFDIPMLAMYCIGMRRSLLDHVGLLDERFATGMFEDDDFCVRVRQAGYRVICATDIYIHHWQRASFDLSGQTRYNALFSANRQRFEEKWGRPWVPHSGPKREADLDLQQFDQNLIHWRCNICDSDCQTPLSALGREAAACGVCGSTTRMRSIIHLLSTELFGESLPLPDMPKRPDLKGIGLSDWDAYAEPLSRLYSYQNTFYHKEPRLDILNPSEALLGKLDFLIATDVFEHVAPPVERAFFNACRLLKPNGVMIFSVPYSLSGHNVEHFPELHEFEIIERRGRRVVRNQTIDGRTQIFERPVFHGGPGLSLEMRLFSENGLRACLMAAGFTQIRFHGEPHFAYGIYWPLPGSLPLVARAA